MKIRMRTTKRANGNTYGDFPSKLHGGQKGKQGRRLASAREVLYVKPRVLSCMTNLGKSNERELPPEEIMRDHPSPPGHHQGVPQ